MVQLGGDLLERRDDRLGRLIVLEDVVQPELHDDRAHAGLDEDVLAEPVQPARPELREAQLVAVVRGGVARQGEVEDAELASAGSRAREPLGEQVRPALVGVQGQERPVADRVTEHDDGAIVPAVAVDLDPGEEVEVLEGQVRGGSVAMR